MNQFEVQLNFLKKEFDSLNGTIGRIDSTTQSVKNWGIMLWTASVSFAMSREEGLRDYVLATAVIPLAFWYMDARWRQVQRQMIFRINEISDFLNGEELLNSIKEGRFVGFSLLDARSKKTEKIKERRDFSTLRKTMFFRTVFIFYGFQLIASIALGVTAILTDKL